MYELLLQWLGLGLCHQLPERSLFGGGVQAPVCARDVGIYAGLLLSIVIVNALQRRPSGLPSLGVGTLLAGFIAVMALDGVTSYAGIRETNNAIRLATGLLGGYGIGALVAPLVNDQLWRTSSSERVLGKTWPLLLWLATLPASYALLWWGRTVFGRLYPLGIAVAILGALTAVNLAIVTLLPAFERRAERVADAWRPLLPAFALTWVEIVASAAIKLWLRSLFR